MGTKKTSDIHLTLRASRSVTLWTLKDKAGNITGGKLSSEASASGKKKLYQQFLYMFELMLTEKPERMNSIKTLGLKSGV